MPISDKLISGPSSSYKQGDRIVLTSRVQIGGDEPRIFEKGHGGTVEKSERLFVTVIMDTPPGGPIRVNKEFVQHAQRELNAR